MRAALAMSAKVVAEESLGDQGQAGEGTITSAGWVLTDSICLPTLVGGAVSTYDCRIRFHRSFRPTPRQTGK